MQENCGMCTACRHVNTVIIVMFTCKLSFQPQATKWLRQKSFTAIRIFGCEAGLHKVQKDRWRPERNALGCKGLSLKRTLAFGLHIERLL